MVAPRSLPEPVDISKHRLFPGQAGPPGESLAVLAARWGELTADPDDETVAGRLVLLLRQLVSVLHAEPFRPVAARPIGAALVASGMAAGPAPEDLLAASLQLLRTAGATLGVGDVTESHRLTAVLDEFATGFAGALTGPPRRPPLAAMPDTPRAPASDPHYRTVFEQGAVGIALVGLDGRLIDLNPTLLHLLGLDELPAELPTFSDFVHPDDLTDLIERFVRIVRAEPPMQRTEVRLVRTDSDVVWAQLTGSLVLNPDGTPSHLVTFIDDISDRQRLLTRLQHASTRDQLTRLPGPALVDQWLHRAFGPGGADRVGICALDLDGFQAVNDALGDAVGDRLLLGVVGRLQLAAGDHLMARTGSDEFTVLVADPENVADVCRFADRLQAALATPFVIAGHAVAVTVSIGVAEGPTARSCPTEMLRAADVARSWAKAMGGGRRVVFDHHRDAGEAARFALLRGLRGGIGRNEFRLDYQPLVQLADGTLGGVEALVRWQHPEQGLIGPGRFIELAEFSGAIVPLGRWVLETACERAAQWWRDLGPDAPYVSVNVSPVQLAEPGWLREVTSVLEATGLPPAKLQLEITEQAVLGDEASIMDALGALRDAGVRLALDDFGTGYSSLSWLRRLPVHALKIDGSFIDGLRKPEMDTVDAAIVRALIDMAHALGLEVTAEWVETPEQAERLGAMGCDTGQGRWFGDAGPGEWVPELWRRSIGR
ncbi:MAG: EAL domain-containing protein [Pseudonocardia sp.]|uniref:putative bifunctional diguanylate cyclase/phosphodiesterase n=1 Tax=Pseudonocardia sp. TaxID=60912 RepID=UPI001AD51CD6|nr:EAL domain-containing protein [Pseudonocardia sp.]MBN9102194.1 EAL domain-containing protein [Pseudonocardia sp.]